MGENQTEGLPEGLGGFLAYEVENEVDIVNRRNYERMQPVQGNVSPGIEQEEK
jgi:hypothetical protein